MSEESCVKKVYKILSFIQSLTHKDKETATAVSRTHKYGHLITYYFPF